MLKFNSTENNPSTEHLTHPETVFVPMDGSWKFESTSATYQGPATWEGPPERQGSDGFCLAKTRLRSGRLTVKVTFEDPSCAARFVFGFNSTTGSYYSVGINGWYRAYVLGAFNKKGAQLLRAEGPSSMLVAGEKLIEASIRGQRVCLSVDSVLVLDHILQSPVEGNEIGLYAWGRKPVRFDELLVDSASPRAFVVMQFGGQYDVLWNDVIEPVAKKAGFDPVRADNIYGPGIILRDVIEQIEASDVIIAEVTPSNPNVFYELGYSHAVGKPAILLANKDDTDELPFDISGYRVVFYSDTIAGKNDVEIALRKHLEAVRLGQDSKI